MRKHSLAGVSMVLAAAAAAPLAASEADSKLLEILRARGSITEAEYQDLKTLYGDEAQKAAASDVKVSTKGGIGLETADGANSVNLAGRIMVDAMGADKDNIDLNTGAEFRRARLELKGQIQHDWAYAAVADFAENDVALKDMYIGYKPWGVKVGQFKMPASLEELTSSKYITFMERSLPNTFATGRRIGLGWSTGWDMGTFSVAGYGQETGGSETEEGFGYGARATFAPINSAGSVVHLGGWAAQENPSDTNTDTLRLRQRPEAHIPDRLVNTGSMPGVDDMTKWGVEAAAVAGPFSAQAEYMTMDVARSSGFDDVDFDGWYAFASWFLTGESRPYKASSGAFDRVKPLHPVTDGGMGAWELALRRSNIDLTDGSVFGGEMDNWTVGLNWHLTDYVRVMLNYINVEAEGPLNDEPNILQARFQIDWK